MLFQFNLTFGLSLSKASAHQHNHDVEYSFNSFPKSLPRT